MLVWQAKCIGIITSIELPSRYKVMLLFLVRLFAKWTNCCLCDWQCYYCRDRFLTLVSCGLCGSAITVRRRRCTTAVGTPATAPSSVSRSTGMSNTSACVAANATDFTTMTTDRPSGTWQTGRFVTDMTDCIGSVIAV